MSGRDELVERGAEALAGWVNETNQGFTFTAKDFAAESAVILDAVYPTVSTAAELAALPLGSIVVSHNGYPFERSFDQEMSVGGEFAGTVDEIAAQFAPLTVVWKP